MAYTSWRGVVGCIKPTLRAGSTEDLIRILPEGVGFIPLHMSLPEARGRDRLEASRRQLDERIAELAEQGVNLILPEGTAAYMIDGAASERRLLAHWRRRFKVPVYPTGLNLVNAMKALGLRKVIGIRPFTWKEGADFTARYFRESGFDVLAMVSPEGYDAGSVTEITPHDIYTAAKKAFLAHPHADGIFTVAGVMRVGTIAQTIEDDLGIPVVANVAARCWQIQKELRIREPIPGFGRLLTEIP
jgi:maleate cis-trans isomerase